MVELLLVKVTLFWSNFASLNWRQISSFSLRLAWHLSCVPKPGAGIQLSDVGVCVRVQSVHANNSARQQALFMKLSALPSY